MKVGVLGGLGRGRAHKNDNKKVDEGRFREKF